MAEEGITSVGGSEEDLQENKRKLEELQKTAFGRTADRIVNAGSAVAKSIGELAEPTQPKPLPKEPVADDRFIPLNVDTDPSRPVADDGIGVVGGNKEDLQANKDAYDATWFSDGISVVPIAGPIVGAIGDVAIGTGRSMAHGGNIAVNLIRDLERAAESGPRDETWDAGRKHAFADENLKDIPANQRWRYMATRNEQEARMLLQQSKEDAAAMRINAAMGGVKDFASSFFAGIVDIDTPLTFMTGGLSAGAKAGLASTRVGRMALGGVSGAAVGVGLGTLDYAVNPNSDSDSILAFGMFGGGLGLFAGGLSRGIGRDVNWENTRLAQEDFGEALRQPGRYDKPEPAVVDNPYGFQRLEDTPIWEGGTKKPGAEEAVGEVPDGRGVDPAEMPKAGDIVGERGSLGARGAIGANPAAGVQASESKNLILAAQKRDSIEKVSDEIYNPQWNDTTKITDFMGRSANRLSEFAQKLGIGTDWGRMMYSNSVVARMFAFDFLESPAGRARNNLTAAVLSEMNRKEMAATFQPFVDVMKEWTTANHGLSLVDRHMTDAGRRAVQDFNEKVITELMARAHGGQRTVDELIRRAADAHDKLYALDIEIGQGRGTGMGIKAYDDMKAKSGYVKQSWAGKSMQRMIDAAGGAHTPAGKKMLRMIVQAVDENYAALHPNIDPAARRTYAEAVVDRALVDRTSISRDVLGILNGDEKDFVKATLMRGGKVTEKEADRVIEALIGSRETKSRPGHTQARIDVDFRAVSSNGIRMMDLLDTDLFSMAHQRMAKTSGLAAMARKGIRSKTEFEAVVRAIKDELNVNPDTPPTNWWERWSDERNKLDDHFFDSMYSYFNGTPIAGGISPEISMIKKGTNLALMNQLGLTSLSESGATIGVVGFRRFMEHQTADIMNSIKKADSPLTQELKHMGIFIPEENVWRPDMMFEIEKAQSSSELMRNLDGVMNKGLRLQGYLSGFFQVRATQQKVAMTSATSKVFEGIRTGKNQFSAERLKDIGLDAANWKKYVDNGTVIFDKDGNLVSLQLNKWDYLDKEAYSASMTRVSNQLIQKAMIGESNVLFHKDGLAQLFWQFKSFPLLAMEKQFHRNMRMADASVLPMFMFGVVTAGLAFTAKQVINGNTQNLTASKIARGGINMSNLTGWMPMWIDPIAAVLGLESYNMSGYGSFGGPSVLSMPAAFTTLDRVFRLPQSVAKVTGSTTGLVEYSNEDIRNLQSASMIGQLYGANAALNMLKKPPRRKKAEAEKAAPEPVTPQEDLVDTALEASGLEPALD